jgi:hypothetical protein
MPSEGRKPRVGNSTRRSSLSRRWHNQRDTAETEPTAIGSWRAQPPREGCRASWTKKFSIYPLGGAPGSRIRAFSARGRAPSRGQENNSAPVSDEHSRRRSPLAGRGTFVPWPTRIGRIRPELAGATGHSTPENRCKTAIPLVGSVGPHGVRVPLRAGALVPCRGSAGLHADGGEQLSRDVDEAAAHDGVSAAQLRDVLRRIAIDQHEVGVLADLDRAR